MRLFPMRTFPASGNGLSCLRRVFRPLTDSDQQNFHIFLCHIGVQTFLDKIKLLKCVRNICCNILLELIVSALKTDKCSSVEIIRRTQLPWLRIR